MTCTSCSRAAPDGTRVFTVSIALGLLLQSGGLIAAMTAHAVADLIIVFVARAKLRSTGA